MHPIKMKNGHSNPEEENKFSLFQLDPVFLRKILSRSTSPRSTSSRYFGSTISSTPFRWEVHPGTSKDPPNTEAEPPVVPPLATFTQDIKNIKKTKAKREKGMKSSEEFGFSDSDTEHQKNLSSLSSFLLVPPPPSISQARVKPWVSPMARVSRFWGKKFQKYQNGKRGKAKSEGVKANADDDSSTSSGNSLKNSSPLRKLTRRLVKWAT
ncbi:hypothetical protein SLE2022_272170 [Rubroshorea leprosula]